MSAPWYDPRIARGMAAQLTRWHERIKAGEKPLGWKAGFGTAEAMERLRIGAPLVAPLTGATEIESGAKVDLAGWTKPLLETEIAVHLGKTLPGGASRDAAKAAISGISAAIELVDLDTPPEDVAAILAGNVYHRRVIVAKCDRSRSGCRLDGLTLIVSRNGGEIARTEELLAATGDVVDVVRHVADLLGAFGEQLKAGQIVICGAIVPPFPAEPGDEFTFTLHESTSVSVRFARPG